MFLFCFFFPFCVLRVVRPSILTGANSGIVLVRWLKRMYVHVRYIPATLIFRKLCKNTRVVYDCIRQPGPVNKIFMNLCTRKMLSHTHHLWKRRPASKSELALCTCSRTCGDGGSDSTGVTTGSLGASRLLALLGLRLLLLRFSLLLFFFRSLLLLDGSLFVLLLLEELFFLSFADVGITIGSVRPTRPLSAWECKNSRSRLCFSLQLPSL